MRTFAETAKKEAEEKIAKAGMSGIVTSEGIKWDILNKVVTEMEKRTRK
jgi:hypothetical protein